MIHGLRVRAHAAWLAARDPRCPVAARLVGLIVAAYALSPIDLVPDFIPVLGLIDDALLVPFGLWLFTRMIPDPLWREQLARAEAAAATPVSRLGMAAIILVWVTALSLVGWWAYARYD